MTVIGLRRQTAARVVAMLVGALWAWTGGADAAQAQDKRPPTYKAPSKPGDVPLLISRPRGRQFATVGLSGSLWLGSGTVSTLSAQGEVGDPIGTFDEQAWGIGPLTVGLVHFVTSSVLFDAHIGLGAVHFTSDRLISTDLDAEGEPHTGLLVHGEMRGRWLGESGVTAALGLGLTSAGMPDSTGGLMTLTPYIGYLSWKQGYTGFWLVDVGYGWPLINGLIPEFSDARLDLPIESRWQQLKLSVRLGF